MSAVFTYLLIGGFALIGLGVVVALVFLVNTSRRKQ